MVIELTPRKGIAGIDFTYKFNVGDVVAPKKTVKFINGSIHRIGEAITITPETLSYYHICEACYDFAK